MAYERISASPVVFQNAITSTATGTEWTVDKKAELMQIEFLISNGGTFAATFQGSFDKTNWHSIGVTNLATYDVVSSATDATPVYEIDLDKWDYIRISVTALSGTLTCNGYYGMVVGQND